MSDPVWFEPLRMIDASILKQQGILFNDTLTISGIRDEIRQLLEACDHQAWIAGLADQDRLPQAVLAFQTLDEATRRAALLVFSNEQGLSAAILQGALQKAFWSCDLYRLELTLPADDSASIPVIRALGFQEEGRLRKCRMVPNTNRHQDVMMYSMLRPEHQAFGTAFIPFRPGVVAVTGHTGGLTATTFTRCGARFDNNYQQECAELAGLLDEDGQLLERASLEARMAGRYTIVPENAPDPVREAAGQVLDYFNGQRRQFDLPLDLSCGSDFQTRVWRALAEIPFGTTSTYEELAYRLKPGDWQAARRMARAIGSACGANPLPLILPCHRVIGKDGRLVGFSGGLDIKEYLLDHEIMGLNN
jgi:O-6-methylguanine DNA methyltransferase